MTKYKKKEDGIEVNNENLPRILEQLANKDYVKKIEANKEEGWIRITMNEGIGHFHYGGYIDILDIGVYPACSDYKTYTAYWSQPTNVWLAKLYDCPNVIRFDLNKKIGKLYLYTNHRNFSILIKKAVIVFDEDDEFVEMFNTEKTTLNNAMGEHDYVKVE